MIHSENPLSALAQAWAAIRLISGDTEVNFSRLMAPLVSRHHYNEGEMAEVIAGFMSGFAIGDDSEVGDFVEVGPDNLRMSLFLLWLMAEEQTTAFAGAFQAKTTEKHREKAGTFFDHHTCVEARKPVGISHPNLRRFLSRGSVVTIYFADPT